MLNINTYEIGNEISRLKNLIEDYENNYIKLYMELSDASFSWREDAHAKAFFNDIKYEKASESEYYSTLKKLYDVFNYMSNRYQRIGEKLSIDIEERDNILAKYTSCINKTNEIINYYKYLETSFCPYEKRLIENQIIRLTNLKKKYKFTKDRVKTTLDRIEEIEKEIKNRLSKISVPKIDEMDINLYLPED